MTSETAGKSRNPIRDDMLAMLQFARIGAYAVSLDQTILFWNRSAQRILGHSSEDVLGRKCYEVLSGRRPGEMAAGCMGGCPSVRSLSLRRVPSPVGMELLCSSGERQRLFLVPMVVGGAMGDAPLLLHLFDDDAQFERLSGELASLPRELSQHGVQVVSPVPLNEEQLPDSVNLTPRELEVLRLVALGWDVPGIAEDLEISPHTVRNHIRRFRAKLKAPTRLDAVVAGLRLGILKVNQSE